LLYQTAFVFEDGSALSSAGSSIDRNADNSTALARVGSSKSKAREKSPNARAPVEKPTRSIKKLHIS
jgi:hypothetical protein